MSSKYQIVVIAFILAAAGLFIVWYKATYLNIPLTPHAKRAIYTISAEMTVPDSTSPVHLSLALPASQEGMRIVGEEIESGNFGYTVAQTPYGRRGEWAKRSLKKRAKLYYNIIVSPEPGFKVAETDEKPETNLTPGQSDALTLWDPSAVSAATALLEQVRERSADPLTFTAELISQFNATNQDPSIPVLLGIDGENKLSIILTLLAHEGIVYRKVRGIYLEDRQKGRRLITMLEVLYRGQWQLFSFKSGRIYTPENFFVWQRGGESLFDVEGGVKAKLRFSVAEKVIPLQESILQSQKRFEGSAMTFSLYSLPVSQQNAFKQLLLVPIGALIVVFMRIMLGIRTLGTFMPVLFALAFMQTTLLSGLLMFFIVVTAGLFIRSYLSWLHLLLVARISAVIIVVIALMSVVSIVSYKLGFNNMLSITFFPMIILSWTIERMSILWEEEGGHEVLMRGGGSLIVAVAAYFAMDNPLVGYLTFNFPELLLVVLSLIILIGRYTGYRLSELMRFAPLGR